MKAMSGTPAGYDTYWVVEVPLPVITLSRIVTSCGPGEPHSPSPMVALSRISLPSIRCPSALPSRKRPLPLPVIVLPVQSVAEPSVDNW